MPLGASSQGVRSCSKEPRWTNSIAAGVFPRELAYRVAGPMNHSRWLTLAIRLMQLYTVTPNPMAGLQKVVIRYIVQVYLPGWFQIKSHSKFTSGPANLFHKIGMINCQPMETQYQVNKVVQRMPTLLIMGLCCSACWSQISRYPEPRLSPSSRQQEISLPNLLGLKF